MNVVLDSNDQRGGATEAAKADKTHAQVLADLAKEVELFHASPDEAYAAIPVSGHIEIWPVRHINDPNIQLNTSPVPLPAAAWLFGSGLLGLMGVARRKKA